jgi:hypothetical protein
MVQEGPYGIAIPRKTLAIAEEAGGYAYTQHEETYDKARHIN